MTTAQVERSLPWLFLGGLLMYLATAVVNIGFIALDDYESGIAPVVPAQAQNPAEFIRGSDFRSPIPTLTLLGISKVAYFLGVEDPANQYRVVLAVLALFSFGMNAWFGAKHFRLAQPRENLYQAVVLFLVGFYFLCPLFMTRPMIEALAAPFLTASSYFACAYFKEKENIAKRLGQLLGALFFLTLASLYRFQAGVCLLALILTVLAARKPRDLFLLFRTGAILFIATGLLDWALKGGFHTTLMAYLRFNLANSSSFGTSPFYMFLLLFLGISLPPVFLSRYRNLNWVEEYLPLLPAVLYFAVFVLGHSLIPHKEERFMVPILPLFLIVLTPLATYLFRAHQTGQGSKWRLRYFLFFNFLLLGLASFNIAQNNIVGMARFIHRHPGITSVLGIEDTLVLFPRAFILHSITDRPINWEELKSVSGTGCHEVLAVRHEFAARTLATLPSFHTIAEFQPGFLEALAVKLNPRHNARRGAIELMAPKSCSF